MKDTNEPCDPPTDPKLRLYLIALNRLQHRDRGWRPAYLRYLGQSDAQRLAWIARIEARAQRQREFPHAHQARQVVTMAIAIRMTT
jgi:hypothetical protein